MRQLAKDINAFLNEVILQAENQHEILIGHCTSEVALTNTQEHILMLLSEESLTNSELAVVSMSVRRQLPRPLSLWSRKGCWKHLKILKMRV